ncbi:hypothetical protein Verru16b_01901 [Lacunisphaera limnophila]|uniref:DUF58 domain-containing protein n=1 Tax=Lacunisphaera limnophila TaxID=1838286 RepID=A0A1D8AVC1_9BACT|nr:DUF58 domain-containing protein [Lacunisphaera limnophila]AOS44832.1 hypothetical protein Verru16b_01901 [Lacunisphaera limnophila]
MPSPVSEHTNLVTSQLALLKQLEWRVRHAVENVLSGEYRSAFRGRGMEFDQVVKYTFGDDIRDIDWNVTARLGEPYRKKFIEEREVSLLLLFEDSVSLQFGSGAQSKREALLELAGLVMMLGAVNRDRVGFLHASPAGYTIKEPVRGRGQILHAAAQLLGQPAPALSSAVSPPPSGFVPWRLLAKAAPRHSILIWLGDFPPRIEPEGWTVLSRRYQTMGFRVEDPWDRELPAGRILTTYDPVAGRLVNLNGASSAQQAAHADWVAQRDAAFRSLFPNPLSRLTVRPDQERLEALVRFFHARMAAGHRR